MTEEPPPAPPEGKLLRAALADLPFSQREAARRATLSESRWRQIVSGYESKKGIKIPVVGPHGTVARMAHAVGVRPEQLQDAGRDDAAASLRDLEAAQSAADSATLPPGSQIRVDERWHMLEALLREAEVGLSPAELNDVLGRLYAYLTAVPGWQPPSNTPGAPKSRKGAGRKGRSTG